jgi:23S rRNA pseudouridine2605 synthase
MRTAATVAKGSSSSVEKDVHDPDGIRLQKVLASAGLGSRRACEDMIAAGRVSVDGQVVSELGVRVDPKRAAISVDGMRIQVDDSMVYLALNKPRGVVSTMRDPDGRPDLSEYVANRTERLFHVGRLDTETEGLLLLTNDGELAHRLAHPSYQVPKTYLAEVTGSVPRDLGKRLRTGLELEDGPVKVDSFRLVDSRPGKALVEVVLHEGRNHIVRRLLDEVGLPVEQLVRTQVGPIRLGDLRTGRTRVLGQAEVGGLLGLVKM